MRVLIFVVLEMASSARPRCSRCLRSFSPNAPKAGSGGRGLVSARIQTQVIIGECERICQKGSIVGQSEGQGPRVSGKTFRAGRCGYWGFFARAMVRSALQVFAGSSK